MTNLQPDPDQKTNSIMWQLMMYRGIILLIAGLILTFFPQGTLSILVFVMGLYWLVDGILTTYNSIKGREIYREWKWALFTGIIGILAGLVAVLQPTLTSIMTTSFIVWFLGLAAVVYGVSGLLTGLRLPKETRGRTNLVLGGLVSVIFGAILISSPYYSVITLMQTMGIIALIGGALLLFVAFRIKKESGA